MEPSLPSALVFVLAACSGTRAGAAVVLLNLAGTRRLRARAHLRRAQDAGLTKYASVAVHTDATRMRQSARVYSCSQVGTTCVPTGTQARRPIKEDLCAEGEGEGYSGAQAPNGCGGISLLRDHVDAIGEMYVPPLTSTLLLSLYKEKAAAVVRPAGGGTSAGEV
eukprot:6204354-Pleurochrysis_carterae.AAC.2